MGIEALLDNKWAFAALSAIGGFVLAIFLQLFLNRRSLFTYYVWHNRIGISTEDQVFGSVRVTWNENPVNNLYLSTVELTNESLRDFENLKVRIFSNDTHLLSQRTEIVDTPNIVLFTPEYAAEIHVPTGQTPTAAQWNTYQSSREYLIPVLNRGQRARFHFLNAATTAQQPNIWMFIAHKGLKVNFRIAQEKYWGVPRPHAAVAGVLLGVALLVVLVTQVESIYSSTAAGFIYGLGAIIPGAAMIRGWRKVRDWYGG